MLARKNLKSNSTERSRSGFVDPVSIGIVSFLVTTLIVGVSVTNNPVKQFLIKSLAWIPKEAEITGGGTSGGNVSVKNNNDDDDWEEPVAVEVPPPVVVETTTEVPATVDLQHPIGGYDFKIVYEKEQTTAKIGYCYNTVDCKEGDQVAGFYYIDGKGYYPIGEEAGGPTQEDLSYLIPKITAQEEQAESIDTSSLTLNQIVGLEPEQNAFVDTTLSHSFELSLYRRYASGENLSLESFVIDYCQSKGGTNCESNTHAYAIEKLEEAGVTTTYIEQQYQEAQKALEPEPEPVVQPKTQEQQISEAETFDYTKTDPTIAKSVAELFNLKPGPYTPQNLYTYDRVKEEQYQSTAQNQVTDIPKTIDYSQVEDQSTTTTDEGFEIQNQALTESQKLNQVGSVQQQINEQKAKNKLEAEQADRKLEFQKEVAELTKPTVQNNLEYTNQEITTQKETGQIFPQEAPRTVNLNTVEPNLIQKITQSLLEANRTINLYTSNSTLGQKLNQVFPLNNLTTSWRLLNEIAFQNQQPEKSVSRFDVGNYPSEADKTVILDTKPKVVEPVIVDEKLSQEAERTVNLNTTVPQPKPTIFQVVKNFVEGLFNPAPAEQPQEKPALAQNLSSALFHSGPTASWRLLTEIAFQNMSSVFPVQPENGSMIGGGNTSTSNITPPIIEVSKSEKLNNSAHEAILTNTTARIPQSMWDQIYSDGVVTPEEKRMLFENYYTPSPNAFIGSATNFGSRGTAIATIFTYGSYIRQQMQRGWVLEASGEYGYHDDLLDELSTFDFIYTNKDRTDILLSQQKSTLYAYFADQNPGPNGEPIPITYEQLNERQKRLYDLTNVGPDRFVREKLMSIEEQSNMTPEDALNTEKYIGIIATKSVNDLGRRFLLYREDESGGEPQFVGVVVVGDYAKRDDWVGFGSPTEQSNADFRNFPLGTRDQQGYNWGFDLTQDLYDYYGGTVDPPLELLQ